ncbi:hypothetical protein [Pseudoalteromonas sp. T1lg22]|uniref:hypothetical protein n=1 Tax=Pseudoalteromonas sp. T1lg22 TaxID=2077096 RepID=UPI000CF5E271|nr:hypothetical protein [Pseudoalteromonas sp. T1lg22]
MKQVNTLSRALCAFVGAMSLTSTAALADWRNEPIYNQQYQSINTCQGQYPSYWQDPNFQPMWAGQTLTNVPNQAYAGPVFQLSDAFPGQPVDDKQAQAWRDKRFDALFAEGTSAKDKYKLALAYSEAVMYYILAGNVQRQDREDFDVCENQVRPWFHMPFQTYDAMSGREFTHGLTREAPVTFSVQAGTGTDQSTMWAVAIYNATAAYTLGQVWQDGGAKVPSDNIRFDEGAVIAKPLFNTSTVAQLPILTNMPSWDANISDPAFCACKPSDSNRHECTLQEESQQCPRSYAQWGDVKLLQFDFAVKDSRARDTGWVYGTFVADGLRKAKEKNPWQRISLLGMMWGNDTPPAGHYAISYPQAPRENGFKEAVIIWDSVDELNKYAGSGRMRAPGHLGCNQRLNGPADNSNSSCMSCHGSASVPDKNFDTPPLLSQFSGDQTHQCVAPLISSTSAGIDRGGDSAQVKYQVAFDTVDATYFTNVGAGESFNMMVVNEQGQKVNLMHDSNAPNYADDDTKQWRSLDYSLQMSIALKQWLQWQANAQLDAKQRVHFKELRRNVE